MPDFLGPLTEDEEERRRRLGGSHLPSPSPMASRIEGLMSTQPSPGDVALQQAMQTTTEQGMQEFADIIPEPQKPSNILRSISILADAVKVAGGISQLNAESKKKPFAGQGGPNYLSGIGAIAEGIGGAAEREIGIREDYENAKTDRLKLLMSLAQEDKRQKLSEAGMLITREEGEDTRTLQLMERFGAPEGFREAYGFPREVSQTMERYYLDNYVNGPELIEMAKKSPANEVVKKGILSPSSPRLAAFIDFAVDTITAETPEAQQALRVLGQSIFGMDPVMVEVLEETLKNLPPSKVSMGALVEEASVRAYGLFLRSGTEKDYSDWLVEDLPNIDKGAAALIDRYSERGLSGKGYSAADKVRLHGMLVDTIVGTLLKSYDLDLMTAKENKGKLIEEIMRQAVGIAGNIDLDGVIKMGTDLEASNAAEIEVQKQLADLKTKKAQEKIQKEQDYDRRIREYLEKHGSSVTIKEAQVAVHAIYAKNKWELPDSEYIGDYGFTRLMGRELKLQMPPYYRRIGEAVGGAVGGAVGAAGRAIETGEFGAVGEAVKATGKAIETGEFPGMKERLPSDRELLFGDVGSDEYIGAYRKRTMPRDLWEATGRPGYKKKKKAE